MSRHRPDVASYHIGVNLYRYYHDVVHIFFECSCLIARHLMFDRAACRLFVVRACRQWCAGTQQCPWTCATSGRAVASKVLMASPANALQRDAEPSRQPASALQAAVASAISRRGLNGRRPSLRPWLPCEAQQVIMFGLRPFGNLCAGLCRLFFRTNSSRKLR